MKHLFPLSSLPFQLAALAAFTFSAFSQAPPGRVLHFPADRSLGQLWVQSENLECRPDPFFSAAFDGEWKYLALARGDVAVPAGLKVKWVVNDNAARDVSPVSRLMPDDLHGISLWGKNVNDHTMAWVTRCTGLKVLEMTMTHLGDADLRKISTLRSLEYLSVPSGATDAGLASVATNLTGLKGLFFASTRISNAGLRYLANLRSLETLTLTGPSVDDAGLVHLAKLPKLEYLSLGQNFTGRGFVHLRKVPSLRVIHCSKGGAIQDAGLEHLAALPNLESLSLCGNEDITDAGMAFLARSRSLRRLDIRNTQVTETGVADLMQNPSWEHLSLSRGSVTDDILVRLGRQSGLKHLDLENPKPRQPYTEKGLAELARLKQLEHLGVAGPGVTDAAMDQIARLKTLKSFSLSSSPISNAGLARLAELKALEKIHLSATKQVAPGGLSQLNALPRLADLYASSIAGDTARLDLGKLTELRSLVIHIRNGFLGDDSLATLKGLHHLEILQLPSTDVSDAGLAHLSGLTNLAFLIIRGPAVTDQGLAHLSRLKALERLRMSGNITDAGLRSLENLERLDLLKLCSPHPISPGAIHRLKQAIPTPLQVNTEKVAATTLTW